MISPERIARIVGDPQSMSVHFQPVVGFDTNRVVAAEALLRVEMDGVRYSPLDVIDAATQAGLARHIGRHVLKTAAEAAKRWQERGDHDVIVSVNVAAAELGDPDLVPETAAILAAASFDPTLVYFELTETALIEQTDQVRTNLAGLAELGVLLALDDFRDRLFVSVPSAFDAVDGPQARPAVHQRRRRRRG